MALQTPAPFNPIGALDGIFSVSLTKTVRFSKGNLQYIGSAGNNDEYNTGAYWKFADAQYIKFGLTTNQNQPGVKTVDRDLFGWTESGIPTGATCYQPWHYSATTSDYYIPSTTDVPLQYDFGYNPILNGGNTQGYGWRMLSYDEINYIFNYRTGSRFARSTVCDVNGIILFPDSMSSYSGLSNINSTTSTYGDNNIDETQWETLEDMGCVFLPTVGYISGSTIVGVNTHANYWTRTKQSSSLGYDIGFNTTATITTHQSYFYACRAIRLVIETT